MADTHSLIWYLGSPGRLGTGARQAFAESVVGQARVVIPVIVLAEIIFVVERGRVRADISQITARLRSFPFFHIAPLRLTTVLRLRTLTGIPEMHDRILVAETLLRKGSLISRDETIARSGIVRTIW